LAYSDEGKLELSEDIRRKLLEASKDFCGKIMRKKERLKKKKMAKLWRSIAKQKLGIPLKRGIKCSWTQTSTKI